MRESMARLTPRFSTNRTVREYTERHYLSAASAYRERAADKGAVGMEVIKWRHALEQKWSALRFGEVKIETEGGQHAFEIDVYLDDVDAETVRVELYADAVMDDTPVRQEMKRVRQLIDAAGASIYHAQVRGVSPPTDNTPRLFPHRCGVAVSMDASHTLSQP